MRKWQEIVGSVLSALLGGGIGGLICYFAGRLAYYFIIELPNKHLDPWIVSAQNCGLSTSIAITTLLAMIPSTVVGAGTGAALSWYVTAKAGEEEK